MEKFTQLTGVAAPLPMINIDTDKIFPAVFLIAFFIPFSYFTDSLTYRMFQKRLARRDAPKTR